MFLAHLHLSQKSYCYTPGVRVCMQNVRANVNVMEFQSLCIFSCILTLLIILIKPLTTKAHNRRASDDCGTSGYFQNGLVATIIVGKRSENKSAYIWGKCECGAGTCDIFRYQPSPKYVKYIVHVSWKSRMK